jgi:N-acyl-phosphatidylethanolamine-hydrolysing phospholipase D
VIKGKDGGFYFTGDTGYFPGFKEIRERCGTLEVVALPIGAYLPRWFMGPVHLNPAEALQAFRELEGKVLLAHHWGTFILADDALELAPQVMMEEAKKGGFDMNRIWLPKPGETTVLKNLQLFNQTN